MSIFGDYKAYKKYEPTYDNWKYQRDINDAKRQKFIKDNHKSIPSEDIQRGKALLRAIDVMDDYSQKRAEDMEVATETAVGYGLDAAIFGGASLGLLIGRLNGVNKLITKLFGKSKVAKNMKLWLPMGIGAVAGVIAAFPLYAWAAKLEISASQKGRFEAMRKDLKDPKAFAILNDKQLQEIEQIIPEINVPKDNKKNKDSNFITLKSLVMKDKEYRKQRKAFELELQEQKNHINDEMTPEEIEKAKKEQQLLTKLVEKIDIASQDYAENLELATGTAITVALGCGTLFSLLATKLLSLAKIKSAGKIGAIIQTASITAPVILSIFAAQMQKKASKVGRYKVKQELLNNPAELAYVSEENIQNIDDVQITKENKKTNIFKFLKQAWKDTKEYNKYEKTTAKDEEKFYKALDKIELTPEQLKNAKILQRNTFKTFNKVDEKSQKYSESIEALGEALSLPISLIFTAIGASIGTKVLLPNKKEAISAIEKMGRYSKYVGIILLSSIPSIILNAYITKEQKKASRIADMLAINEMSDYKEFR